MQTTELFCLAFCLISALEQIQCSKHSAEIHLVQTGATFKGAIHANGKPFELNLLAADHSVFSSNFKLTKAVEGENGETVFEDITPTAQELYEMERNVYTDPIAKAALKIHYEQGELRVHGVLDKMHISHDGFSHFVIFHENMRSNDPRARDYVYPPKDDDAMMISEEIQTRQAAPNQTLFYPEVHIVMDNALYISPAINRSNSNCANYLQLFMRAVNNRYATSNDPKMIFKITGATAMAQPSQQASFMDVCKAGDGSGAFDMDCSLTKFSEFMFEKRASFSKHDLSPLISGALWKTKNSDGTWSDGTVGLAWIKKACFTNTRKNMSLMTSINMDTNATFGGVMTMAHELAHNLGAPHDGADDAKGCPWSDGYIMSYDGWGKENKLFFSSCSLRLMKDYANSPAGSCLKTESSTSWNAATKDLGDLYTMNEQCQRLLGRKDATTYAKSTGDELCKNMKCSYKEKCTNSDNMCTWWIELNSPAYDNSVCGTGKKCYNGKCITR